jgi:hypothetical protein
MAQEVSFEEVNVEGGTSLNVSARSSPLALIKAPSFNLRFSFYLSAFKPKPQEGIFLLVYRIVLFFFFTILCTMYNVQFYRMFNPHNQRSHMHRTPHGLRFPGHMPCRCTVFQHPDFIELLLSAREAFCRSNPTPFVTCGHSYFKRHGHAPIAPMAAYGCTQTKLQGDYRCLGRAGASWSPLLRPPRALSSTTISTCISSRMDQRSGLFHMTLRPRF